MNDETTRSLLKDTESAKGQTGPEISPEDVGEASAKATTNAEAKEAIDRATAAVGQDEG